MMAMTGRRFIVLTKLQPAHRRTQRASESARSWEKAEKGVPIKARGRSCQCRGSEPWYLGRCRGHRRSRPIYRTDCKRSPFCRGRGHRRAVRKRQVYSEEQVPVGCPEWEVGVPQPWLAEEEAWCLLCWALGFEPDRRIRGHWGPAEYSDRPAVWQAGFPATEPLPALGSGSHEPSARQTRVCPDWHPCWCAHSAA